MAVSKALRFQVFSRDKFTCQYCGRTPPTVVLEPDHIHPSARGGSDEIDNLITACSECNNGKGARIISEIAPRPDADLACLKVQQEIAELNRFLKAKKKRDKIWKKACESLRKTWWENVSNFAPKDLILLPWIKRYGIEETNTAILIAGQRNRSQDFGETDEEKLLNLIPYIGAILRNRKRDEGRDVIQ